MGNNNNNNNSLFHVSLKVGSNEFTGEAPTAQGAKHAAASRALLLLKDSSLVQIPRALNPQSIPFIPNNGHHAQPKIAAAAIAAAAAANNQTDSDIEDDLKSPISLVHETALKRGLTVTFQVKLPIYNVQGVSTNVPNKSRSLSLIC